MLVRVIYSQKFSMVFAIFFWATIYVTYEEERFVAKEYQSNNFLLL